MTVDNLEEKRILNALRHHDIFVEHKVNLEHKGYGYYHLILGKAHNTSSWFFNTDVINQLQIEFKLNICAKDHELHITLIKRVQS